MFFFGNISILFLCLNYTCILFIMGLAGLLINKRNILLMLLSLELSFLASSLNFILASSILNLLSGYIYGIFIILVVVADTAIGLSIVVVVYRNSNSANINSLITLRG